jgi:hypothetical protein
MKVTERSQRVNGRPHLKKGVFPNWLQTGSVLPRAAPVLLLESPNGLHVKSVVSEINVIGTRYHCPDFRSMERDFPTKKTEGLAVGCFSSCARASLC